MAIRVRPVVPALDFPRIAELITQVESDPVTAEALHEREQRRPHGYVGIHLVAADDEERVAGYAKAEHLPWMRPGFFWSWVVVDEQRQREGIGSLLAGQIIEFAASQGATRLESELRDNCARCLRFAERHGFTPYTRHFESMLDLTSFDERRFGGAVKVVEEMGIRFFTLADIPQTTESERAYYELWSDAARDVPGVEAFGNPPFEQFRESLFGAAEFRPDCHIVAADGEDWVGFTAMEYSAESNSAYNRMTGVRRSHRGRQLALALKLLAIRRAREYGAAQMRTHNGSQNEAMLAVNRKLGYQPEPGYYIVARDSD